MLVPVVFTTKPILVGIKVPGRNNSPPWLSIAAWAIMLYAVSGGRAKHRMLIKIL
jgi:hypothetical protein